LEDTVSIEKVNQVEALHLKT